MYFAGVYKHRRIMIPVSFATVLFCAGMSAPPAQAAGQSGDFTYDMYRAGDSVGFWIDLAPVLGQSQMEDLLAGLDIYISLDIRLESPRPFFFPRLLVRKRAALILSHRLTEDLYTIERIGAHPLKRQFDNQLQVRDFIADSMEFNLTAIEALDAGDKYRITVSISSKSYSSKEMARHLSMPPDTLGSSNKPGPEFFESLFSTFIEVTGFGRASFHVTTPNFILKDITLSVP
jgi:hypothetical protein